MKNVHQRYNSLIPVKYLVLLSYWDVDLTHKIHEENFAVDYLAKLENSTSSNLIIQQDTFYDMSGCFRCFIHEKF
jgi:hypothetical protein